MPASYSFFETAAMKGYILQVFNELIPRHWDRAINSDVNGTAFRFGATRHASDVVLIDVLIEGRRPTESQAIWRERARGEALKAWQKYVRERDAAKAARESETGPAGTDGSNQASSPADTVSLIPSPTVSDQSLGTPPAADAASSDSVLSGPTLNESARTKISIRNSRRA